MHQTQNKSFEHLSVAQQLCSNSFGHFSLDNKQKEANTLKQQKASLQRMLCRICFRKFAQTKQTNLFRHICFDQAALIHLLGTIC